MRSARSILIVSAFAAAAWASAAPAAPPERAGQTRGARLGPIVDAPDGQGEMELLRFDESLTATLQVLGPEESVLVGDWPISPGRRVMAALRRFDVYAPDARIVVIGDGREIEIPRARTKFFMGARPDGHGRFLVALEPETGAIRVSERSGDVDFEIRAMDDGSGIHRLATRMSFDLADASGLSWSCGQEELTLEEGGALARRAPIGPVAEAASVQALAPATRIAVIAVDTDNELLSLKFGNDTTAATTYIANLFAEMNVMYERDVNLRLLQGYTILRPSTTPDPYLQSGTGNADSAKLGEFRTYWNANYGSVQRALAVMLSGKQSSAFAGSGIAALDVLCSGFGYSFTQVFKFAQQTATYDDGLVGHEIGHNMASPHTHCYADPKPDTCYAGETGATCFAGTPSCPPQSVYNGVTAAGTLMSYCNMLSGCSSADVFHPYSLTRYINNAVASATSCVFAIGAAAPTITNVSPATGPLSGGTTLTITGTNFTNGALVAFVDLPSDDVFGTPSSKVASTVAWNSSMQLTVTTPSAAAGGAVDVVVMNPDFQTATARSGFTYTPGPAPFVLSSIVPTGGSVAGGTTVTLAGSGFQAGLSVSIGGAAAATSTVTSSSITATTSAHVPAVVDVVVANPGGESRTLPLAYSYSPAPIPAGFFTLTPCRIFDTRNASGPDAGAPAMAAGESRVYAVAGKCGVPGDARSVSVNVTVCCSTVPGILHVVPGNGTVGPASGTAYRAGRVIAASSMPALSTDGNGTIRVYNESAGLVHVILDVNGYYR